MSLDGHPQRVRVRVPASSANLGPGFDSAGLALALHDDVEVDRTSTGLSVEVTGEGAGTVPPGEAHLLVVALRAAFEQLGGQPAGLAVRCTNRIPHARGLGSSSAAIVAGIVAARALVDGGEQLLDDAGCLELASRLEGHPDNVAPCLLGGLTIAWCEDGRAGAVRLPVHPDLAPVALVPVTTCSTTMVRGLLPAEVPRLDAVANVARAALLPHALGADPTLLMVATQDRLHQHYRAGAMLPSARCMGELRRAGVPAVISGAGPTVLALTTRAGRAAGVGQPPGFAVLPLDVDLAGARVVSTSP